MKIVDLEAAKKEFIRYVDNYDLINESIDIKKYHSLRVMEISKELAKEEQFLEEETEIATLIGLLHDIARFKQYTEYQTFKDQQSFDHGDMALEILEKKNYLRKYIHTDVYDEIIKKAIKNHNKFAIEEQITNRQKKFCELIRDADQIIQFLAYIYDLNYTASFNIITKYNYIEKIKNRFKFKDEYTNKEILKAIEETQEYILKKLK